MSTRLARERHSGPVHSSQQGHSPNYCYSTVQSEWPGCGHETKCHERGAMQSPAGRPRPGESGQQAVQDPCRSPRAFSEKLSRDRGTMRGEDSGLRVLESTGKVSRSFTLETWRCQGEPLRAQPSSLLKITEYPKELLYTKVISTDI